jgi:aldehyde:ferredoxin oxidoreductase
MTDLGGFQDHVARVDLTTEDVNYESVDDEDARKYIGARGLGVKYVFEQGPDVDPLGPENLLAFTNGPLTGTQVTMSGRIAICTKSPLTHTVTDSHHGGWSGARLKWAGFDGLLFEGQADDPVYAYVEDDEVELRDAAHLSGKGVHETRDIIEEELDGAYGKNLSIMAIGEAGENGVKYACIMNEDDRASGRGGTGCVMGNKNLKAVVVKSPTRMPKPADPETFKQGHRQAMEVIQESEVTGPNEGGLSVYGTNVLMNMTEEISGLPTRNARYTSTADEAEAAPEAPNIDAENVSGENVRENILVDEPTCHSCPVACKKEVEVDAMHKGEELNVRMESYEYESAWALGPNSMNDDRDKIAVMIDRCNDHGMDTIETGNMLAQAMELTEEGKLDDLGDGIQWGDAEEMIEMISRIAARETELADHMAEGQGHMAEQFGDPATDTLTVKNQAIAAYDPRCMKGMGIAYATSNRGACHLRGYTPAAEILGIPEKVDPYEWEGKGELTATFQDMHAISDSFDICKFNAFAEGVEEYVLQYNGMTGRDVDEEDMMEMGERVYNLERYYNNLVGFDGSDDDLPARFLPGEEAIPGQGASDDELVELDEMKQEYYAHRGWVDGVVPDEKLDALAIEIGPGTGVSSEGGAAAPGDD